MKVSILFLFVVVGVSLASEAVEVENGVVCENWMSAFPFFKQSPPTRFKSQEIMMLMELSRYINKKIPSFLQVSKSFKAFFPECYIIHELIMFRTL